MPRKTLSQAELERNIRARLTGQPYDVPVIEQIKHPNYWPTLNAIARQLMTPEEKHAESQKRYYQKNRERILKCAREYYKKNHELIRESRRISDRERYLKKTGLRL